MLFSRYTIGPKSKNIKRLPLLNNNYEPQNLRTLRTLQVPSWDSELKSPLLSNITHLH